MLIEVFRRNRDGCLLVAFDGHDKDVPVDFHLISFYDSGTVLCRKDNEELEEEFEAVSGHTFQQVSGSMALTLEDVQRKQNSLMALDAQVNRRKR